MTRDGFAERLLDRARRAGVTVDPAWVLQLQRYYELLERWNRSINLTALPLADFPTQTLDRLLLEPLVALPAASVLSDQWVDLGSGGGSPAIPLAIALGAGVSGSGLRLTLTESRGKKAAFLREAVRELRITATVLGRFEELLGWKEGSVRLITCRAVHLDEIAALVAYLLAPRGRLLYFGANVVAVAGLGLIDNVGLPSGDGVLSVLERQS